MAPARRPLTYARSGVRRDEVGRGLRALLAGARYAPPPSSGRALRLPGHFAGVVQIGRERLALTTDNVGTKLLLAAELHRWEEVGEDVVAVNVNDLAAVGARPCGLVDYLACVRPDPKVLAAIGRGIGRGLRKARCGLLGGETSVVPDLVRSLDLSATALGFFPPGRAPVTGERLREGDVILGLPSSGFHANGYTLVRRLVERDRIDLGRPLPGDRRPLGTRLLAPTVTYTPYVEALVDAGLPTGLAHLSGGGLRNVVRLRSDVEFCFDQLPEPPSLFRWAAELAGLGPSELYQTFNMGVGFVAMVRPRQEDRALSLLRRVGCRGARVVGHVTEGGGVSVPAFGLHFREY